MQYIQRQCDEPAVPTHWVRGISSTALSQKLAELDAIDISTSPQSGWTPAVFDEVSTVLYYLDPMD